MKQVEKMTQTVVNFVAIVAAAAVVLSDLPLVSCQSPNRNSAASASEKSSAVVLEKVGSFQSILEKLSAARSRLKNEAGGKSSNATY